MHSRNTLIRLSAVVLAFAATPKLLSETFHPLPAQAQATGQSNFTLPSSLPSGTTLKVDGSTSMEISNQNLEGKFEQQYGGATVDLAENGTDKALEALRNGTVSVVAAGRVLTDAEKAEGLKESRLSREKIAIIVGPENPYTGDITFEQFAQIFRGDITDWSQLGGQPGPIRFIDRPDFSDTRQAFRTYPVFQAAPFQTGATATQIATDETADVIKELGQDGISYAIADQVLDNSSVKIIPMHQTLPDDPRYPFSQPRAYIFREADPAAQAFLALASGATVAAVASPAASPGAAVSPSPEAAISPSPEAAVSSPEAVAQAPVTTVETERGGGFPLWLLALPLIGGLLWWLAKGRTPAPAAVPAAAPVAVPPVARVPEGRMILTPRDCRNAYAYWEVPEARKAQVRDQGGRKLALRLYDVTDVDMEHQVPHSVKQFDCRDREPDLHLPIAVDNRDYIAELGYVTEDGRWLKVTRSEPVRVPACAPAANPVATAAPVAEPPAKPAGGLGAGAALAGGAAVAGLAAAGAALNNAAKPSPEPVAPADLKSRLVLTPRDSRDLYAYWEVPEAEKALLKQQGGQQPQIRLHDVTGLEAKAALPPAIQKLDYTEADQDKHLLVPATDRDYLAEIGYQTGDGRWLKLARSNVARVPSAPEAGTGLAGAGLAAAGLAGAGLAGGAVARSITSDARPAEVDRQQVTPEAAPATSPAVTHATADLAAAATGAATVTPREVKHITVHSRHNCFLLNEEQMRNLQDHTAVKQALVPGKHVIRIKSGAFGYGVTPETTEPLVLLWIFGGKVVNHATKVPVAATWSTLNGYEDELVLDVLEPATLHAFFFDTHINDNDGDVTLSITSTPAVSS